MFQSIGRRDLATVTVATRDNAEQEAVLLDLLRRYDGVYRIRGWQSAAVT